MKLIRSELQTSASETLQWKDLQSAAVAIYRTRQKENASFAKIPRGSSKGNDGRDRLKEEANKFVRYIL